MFKNFIKLEWKAITRSSSFGKQLAVKIFMIFLGIWMLFGAVSMGAGMFFALKKFFPDVDPVQKVSEYLIYWILFELVFRYFMQKLPVMDVKPMLILPVKKDIVTKYILGKSGLSFFNFISLFIFIPFAVVLLFQGYAVVNVIFWFLSIVCIILSLNYINFIINKSDKALFIIAGIALVLYGVHYFNLAPVTENFRIAFYTLYKYPAAFVAPLAVLLGTYGSNFNYLRNRIYLDASIKEKISEVETKDMSWTKRFGAIAPFLRLDLKLIWRNKRTKMQVFMSLLMIFYGLIFYLNDQFSSMSYMMVFCGIFITGIFLMNFGQFIPAWDSEYYSMMMSQNIPLRKYLESKAGLISVSILVMTILSVPYVYFGWQALAINVSCALYNLGVNIPVVLYFGSKNKKRIDLAKSAMGNTQGMSAAQLIVGLPLFCIPMIIYAGLNYLVSLEVALAVLSVLGIIGFLLRKPLLDKITELYRKKKYVMIAGFKEQNN